MKQNEKFLVYAVTGFLVVILAVAILFGKEQPRRLPNDPTATPTAAVAPPSLEDVLNRRSAPAPEVVPAPAVEPTANGSAPAGGTPAVPAPAPGAVDGAAVPAAAVGDQPLSANVQLLPPTAAALVTEKLGLSRRDREYRVVRARAGDSLGALVQKWCGATGDYLELAKGLNEELTTLRVGQEIWLPWIDDEALLAAYERSHPAASPRPVGAGTVPAAAVADREQPATTPAEAKAVPATGAAPAAASFSPIPVGGSTSGAPTGSAARKYTIKAGDSLWKIAEREVGRKQAKQFLDQVLELNPGLESDRIREGQVIQLPQKG